MCLLNASQRPKVKRGNCIFQACFVWDSFGLEYGDRVGLWGVGVFRECQLVHTVRPYTTPPPLLPQPTTTVRKSLVCLVRSSGQLVPRQLHGCGVAGKEPVPDKPRRGFCICSAVDPPTPTSLPSCPPHTAMLHQLRAAGETAGRCCHGKRRAENVFL